MTEAPYLVNENTIVEVRFLEATRTHEKAGGFLALDNLFDLDYTGRNRGGCLMSENSRAAGARAADSGAYLGPGSKATGRLVFEGPTTIEGEIDGEISVHGSLTIGENAVIKGKINATSVLVRGKVNADIQADKKIDLQPPAVVVGDVTTQSLVIGDGAILEGHCAMRKEKEGKVLPLLRQEPAARKADEPVLDQ